MPQTDSWIAKALFDDHVHPNAFGRALLGCALAETMKAQPAFSRGPPR